MMAHEAGKGDKQRPTDTKVFETNFQGIYGDKKPVRGSFVWCDKQQKLISKDEYYANRAEVNAPMVMNDIQPYKSMQTGEKIGNEKMPERRPEPKYDSENVKREIARQLYK
jgi:capsule polysaccharide modification protein KpsS